MSSLFHWILCRWIMFTVLFRAISISLILVGDRKSIRPPKLASIFPWIDKYHMVTEQNASRKESVKLWRRDQVCAFRRVDEAVSDGKPSAGNNNNNNTQLITDEDGLLSWHGSHFWVCFTFCKVRHGDSVTKPDYYYHCLLLLYFEHWFDQDERHWTTRPGSNDFTITI